MKETTIMNEHKKLDRDEIKEIIMPFLCEHEGCSDSMNKQYPECMYNARGICPVSNCSEKIADAIAERIGKLKKEESNARD
jgi:hypothetical protein